MLRLLLVLLLTTSVWGQPAPSPSPEKEVVETWQDPLVYGTRLVTYAEANLRSDGSFYNQVVLEPRIGLGDDNALDLKLPIGSNRGQGINLGVGDVEIEYLRLHIEQDRWATGGGVKLVLPTGSAAEGGSGRVEIDPSYGLAYWVSPRLKLLAFVEYQHSIYERAGIPVRRNLLFRPTVFYYLPQDFYLSLQLRGTSNLVTGQWLTQVEYTLGHTADDGPEVFITVRTPLNRAGWDNLDRSKVKVGLSFTF